MVKPIEPNSATERPISETDRAMIAEQEAIMIGVAEITFAWSSVENAFVFLLAEIIGHRPGDVASAIYFAPAGIEVRSNIVDKAFRAFVDLYCRALPSGSEILNLITVEWDAVQRKLGHLRKTRNKVAHGELTVFGETAKRAAFARLTAPIFKLDDGREETSARGQKPGLGSNEIKQSAKAASDLVSRIRDFTEILQLLKQRDSATLLQKLPWVEDDTRRRNDPGNPNPPEP